MTLAKIKKSFKSSPGTALGSMPRYAPTSAKAPRAINTSRFHPAISAFCFLESTDALISISKTNNIQLAVQARVDFVVVHRQDGRIRRNHTNDR